MTYGINVSANNPITVSQIGVDVYFAGKLISSVGDRLGSVRWNGSGHTYYPYGMEYSTSTNDAEKYATYTRDSLTGLDYAMNRYYNSQSPRFMSPDASWASVDLQNPSSWNRYAYVLNDPVNNADPTGRYVEDCDWTGNCFDPWAAGKTLQGGYVGSYSTSGIFLKGPLADMSAQLEAQYVAYVRQAFGWIAGDAPSLILGFEALWNPQQVPGSAQMAFNALQTPDCSGLFNLPPGMTPWDLLSHLSVTYSQENNPNTSQAPRCSPMAK